MKHSTSNEGPFDAINGRFLLVNGKPSVNHTGRILKPLKPFTVRPRLTLEGPSVVRAPDHNACCKQRHPGTKIRIGPMMLRHLQKLRFAKKRELLRGWHALIANRRDCGGSPSRDAKEGAPDAGQQTSSARDVAHT